MEDVDLQALIRQAAEGDTEAAGEIVRRYEGPVRRSIRRSLGAGLRRRSDTDDILQTSLFAALEGLRGFQYRGEEAFVGWLVTVAERKILMAARGQLRQKRDLRREVALDAAAAQAADQTSPSQGAVRNEEVDWLRQAVAALPAEEREIVELHSFEGLGFTEIAGRLGLPGKRSAHHLFRKALRRMAGLSDSEGERGCERKRNG